MKCRFLLTVGVILWSTWSGFAIEKTTVNLDNLVKTFEQNPANPQTTMQLLKELSKQGKSGQDILNRYFKTQSEADYFKDYNWMIVRDYVNDINAPQLKYVFENQDKFIQHFSKDDVFQKLDNVLVNHLEQLYLQNKADYENQMKPDTSTTMLYWIISISKNYGYPEMPKIIFTKPGSYFAISRKTGR